MKSATRKNDNTYGKYKKTKEYKFNIKHLNFTILIRPILTLVVLITTEFLDLDTNYKVLLIIILLLTNLFLVRRYKLSINAVLVCVLSYFILYPYSYRDKYDLINSAISKELYGEELIVTGKILRHNPSKISGEKSIIIELNTLGNKVVKSVGKVIIEVNIPDLPWRLENTLSDNDYVKCSLDSSQFDKQFNFVKSYTNNYISKFYIQGNQYFCKKISNNKNLLENFKLIKENSVNSKISPLARRSLGIIKASILGDETDLDQGTREIFKRTGLYHLLVVSGYHLTLFTGIAKFLTRFIRSKSRFILINYSSHRVCSVVIILITIFFLLISELGTPLVRATLMSSILIIGTNLRRNLSLVETILWSLVFITIIIPFSFLSVSLQLSYSALIGVCIGGNIYEKYKNRVTKIKDENINTFKKINNFFMENIFISLGAFIFSLPVQAYYFGLFNPYSLFYNLFFGFIFTALVIALGAVSLFGIYFLGDFGIYILEINSFFIESMLNILDYLSS